MRKVFLEICWHMILNPACVKSAEYFFQSSCCIFCATEV